jgi:hypothetical protein
MMVEFAHHFPQLTHFSKAVHHLLSLPISAGQKGSESLNYP